MLSQTNWLQEEAIECWDLNRFPNVKLFFFGALYLVFLIATKYINSLYYG